MKAAVLGVALALLAIPARAQTTDARWEPWIGCWELSADTIREGAPAARAGNGSAPQRPRDPSAPRVCVTAVDEGGAHFQTTIGGQPAIAHTIVADAADRPVADAECRGTQRAEWSRDGLRLFTRAELTCDGDDGPRRVDGLSLLAPNRTWLDIQSVEVGGRESVRVRRYYRAAGQPEPLRAILAAAPLTLDEVKDASARVSARTLEAALVETNAGFNLRARHVLELAAAGVPERVIDVIVALSYPERFVIERTARSGATTAPFFNDPYMLGWAFGYPVFYDDFFYSPYYYTPFGYSGYARGYYVPFGTVVPVSPAPAAPQPSGRGRVVDGQGYTRVRIRDEAPGAAAEGPIVRGSSSAPPPASADSSSSGSSSSTASPGGYSGGSSSGDTGRTAQPR